MNEWEIRRYSVEEKQKQIDSRMSIANRCSCPVLSRYTVIVKAHSKERRLLTLPAAVCFTLWTCRGIRGETQTFTVGPALCVENISLSTILIGNPTIPPGVTCHLSLVTSPPYLLRVDNWYSVFASCIRALVVKHPLHIDKFEEVPIQRYLYLLHCATLHCPNTNPKTVQIWKAKQIDK